jgi:ComF family protein
MACEQSLPYLPIPCCEMCALPIPDGNLCGHCLAQPAQFSHSKAVFAYTFPINKLIQNLKYGNQLALADTLAKRLAQKIDRNNLPDVIIPMPLHPNKLKQRGYNQAMLLAKKLAAELHIELLSHTCERTRDTVSQSTLPFKERGKNMRGAFICNADLSDKKIALVDDVLTSGASLNALASAVRKSGASDVQTWVIARTIKK